MPKPNEQAEALIAELRDRLHWLERTAIYQRQISLFLRFLHLLSLVAIPILIFSSHERSLYTTVAGALAIVAVLATNLSQAFRFDARWEQTMLMRERLSKVLYELRANLVELPEADMQRELARVARDFADIESSLWYIGDRRAVSRHE